MLGMQILLFPLVGQCTRADVNQVEATTEEAADQERWMASMGGTGSLLGHSCK